MVFNKRKVFVVVFLFALTIFVLVLAWFINRQSFQKSSAAANVSIYFDPQNTQLPPNKSLRILVNPQGKRVSFIRAVVEFDKSKVNLASEVSLGNSIYTIPTRADSTKLVSTMADANQTGRIDMVFLVNPQNRNQIPTTTFELAKLEFHSLSSQPNQTTTITFDSQEMQIVDYNAEEDMVINSQSASLTLNPTTPTPTPTATPTPTPTSTPTPEPTATPIITPTPSPEPEDVVFHLSFKTQGVSQQAGNHQIAALVTLKNIDEIIYQENKLFGYTSGNYEANFELPNITVGTYDLYIKPPYHLQKKVGGIEVNEGENKILIDEILKAGDFNSSNTLTIEDIAMMLSAYTALSVTPTQTTRKYDINKDGVINIIDVSFVLANYTALSVSGD